MCVCVFLQCFITEINLTPLERHNRCWNYINAEHTNHFLLYLTLTHTQTHSILTNEHAQTMHFSSKLNVTVLCSPSFEAYLSSLPKNFPLFCCLKSYRQINLQSKWTLFILLQCVFMAKYCRKKRSIDRCGYV